MKNFAQKYNFIWHIIAFVETLLKKVTTFYPVDSKPETQYIHQRKGK